MVNNDWLDIAVLEDYLDGKLDAKTMNRVEREALEDPFVAEALAGLSMSPKRSLESLSLLQKQLHERVAEHHSAKKTTVITWQRLSIAAAAAVIFISVGIIFWMKQVNYQEMASKQPKKIDVNIAPKVSSDSVIENADAVATVKTESTDKASTEIDKAIKEAKTNSYASNSKPGTKSITGIKEKTPLTEATIAAAPVAPAEVLNDSSAKLNEVVAAYSKKTQAGAPGLRGTVSIRGLANVKADYDNPAAVRFTIDSKDIDDVPVAVVGGVSTSSSNKTPQPAIGWAKFNSYLTENNTYITHAKKGQSVEFRFEFKDFKPANVVVVRGFSREFDEEVIRLIQTGSNWDVQEAAHPIVFLTIKY